MPIKVTNENHVRYFAYQKFCKFARMVRDAVPEGKLVQQNGVPFDWDGAYLLPEITGYAMILLEKEEL